MDFFVDVFSADVLTTGIATVLFPDNSYSLSVVS